MKALLVNASEKNIKQIDIAGKSEIIDLIGYETVISDEIEAGGDLLFFDEECFLRGAEGRFQLDNLIPVSGFGVIIGSDADGTLQDCQLDEASAAKRIKFLD